MDTKILTLCSIIAVAMLLQACPTDIVPDFCDIDENFIISNPELIHIYPDQTRFHVGDTIWIKSNIEDNQITTVGESIMLTEKPGVTKLQIEGGLGFHSANEIDTINWTNFHSISINAIVDKGEVIENTSSTPNYSVFYLKYNNLNSTYELDIGIVLDQIGYYILCSHPLSNRTRIFAKTGEDCGETYIIYTTLANPNNGYGYTFEVVE